jgi:LacI family transcriptional regulator
LKRPTIKDVAQEAGCSLSTVSLVINNRGYVSEETRKRILKVVDKLGYHPTRSARGLASQTSGNIGFILREDHFSRAEPFYTRVFLGAEFAARDHHFYMILTTIGRQFTETDDIPRFLLERNVDGVIVAGRVHPRFLDRLEGFGLPTILVDFEVKRKLYPAVLIDNHGGARAAVNHLITLGHRDIAFVGGDITHPSLRERFEAYREILDEHGIAGWSGFVDTGEPDSALSSGANAMARILAGQPRPTAVFAANDAMAIGCMQQIRKAGLRIPDDIAVIGFDDIETCSLIEPRLSTVRVFKEELGRLAVEQMARIISTTTHPVITSHVPVELVVRESTVPGNGKTPVTPEHARSTQ